MTVTRAESACTCTVLDGVRLARSPWNTPTRVGCPAHPDDICTEPTQYVRSSSTGDPVATPCNTRTTSGQCPNAGRHEQVST